MLQMVLLTSYWTAGLGSEHSGIDREEAQKSALGSRPREVKGPSLVLSVPRVGVLLVAPCRRRCLQRRSSFEAMVARYSFPFQSDNCAQRSSVGRRKVLLYSNLIFSMNVAQGAPNLMRIPHQRAWLRTCYANETAYLMPIRAPS